jgi:hypothetical protein
VVHTSVSLSTPLIHPSKVDWSGFLPACEAVERRACNPVRGPPLHMCKHVHSWKRLVGSLPYAMTCLPVLLPRAKTLQIIDTYTNALPSRTQASVLAKRRWTLKRQGFVGKPSASREPEYLAGWMDLRVDFCRFVRQRRWRRHQASYVGDKPISRGSRDKKEKKKPGARCDILSKESRG